MLVSSVPSKTPTLHLSRRGSIGSRLLRWMRWGSILKLMLDALEPSAPVTVHGAMQWCWSGRRTAPWDSALTSGSWMPWPTKTLILCPRISETLDSLAGSNFYSTFDLTSGFWQVPMAEDSKQFTAFTLGSMWLFECDRMPFSLCNALATFQRLMQNCLGGMNLTYCLIYLDDVIVYSKTPEEHLMHMRVVFDHLWEHGLKLKPSKCNLFKMEIIYLAHHVSKEGVRLSHRNVEAIMKCAPPKDLHRDLVFHWSGRPLQVLY